MDLNKTYLGDSLELLKKLNDNSIDLVITSPPYSTLDPFMGTGTTALACNNLQRNWIGFELQKEYIDVANKRILDMKK